MTGRTRVRGIVTIVAMAVAGVVMLGASPATPQTGSPITAFHSGKAMDVFEASPAAGAPIVQWTPNGGSNQQWRLLHFSNVPPFELVIIQTIGSKQVLDVDGSAEAGAGLVQRPWAAEESQLWISYPFGNTGYRLLINVESQGLVADVAEASLANGADVILWGWKGGLNQLWTVPPVTAPNTTTSTTTGGSTTTTSAPATTTTTSATKASPTISGNADLAGQVGDPIGDVATLAGGNNPTGTITFTVYTDDACATAPVFTSTRPVSGNGSYASANFVPSFEALYLWVASYSGDANNNPAATACGDLNQVSLVVAEN